MQTGNWRHMPDYKHNQIKSNSVHLTYTLRVNTAHKHLHQVSTALSHCCIYWVGEFNPTWNGLDPQLKSKRTAAVVEPCLVAVTADTNTSAIRQQIHKARCTHTDTHTNIDVTKNIYSARYHKWFSSSMQWHNVASADDNLHSINHRDYTHNAVLTYLQPCTACWLNINAR